MTDQFWWYVARSSGVVAWVAAVASLLVGMALSTRALGPRPRGPWLLDLHRFLAGLSVGFVGLHLVALVADTFVYFGPVELFVPFASDYRPSAVAWGVLAFWLLVVVEGTSLLMHRLPRTAWYAIHLTSYVVAVTATIHGYYAGTDTTNPLYRWSAILALGAAGFFLIYRLLAPAAPSEGGAAGARRARIQAMRTGTAAWPGRASDRQGAERRWGERSEGAQPPESQAAQRQVQGPHPPEAL